MEPWICHTCGWTNREGETHCPCGVPRPEEELTPLEALQRGSADLARRYQLRVEVQPPGGEALTFEAVRELLTQAETRIVEAHIRGGDAGQDWEG